MDIDKALPALRQMKTEMLGEDLGVATSSLVSKLSTIAVVTPNGTHIPQGAQGGQGGSSPSIDAYFERFIVQGTDLGLTEEEVKVCIEETKTWLNKMGWMPEYTGVTEEDAKSYLNQVRNAGFEQQITNVIRAAASEKR